MGSRLGGDRPIRVLALTKYGAEAASTRQRLLQFAPFLEAHGVVIAPRPLLGDGYVRALARGDRGSLAAIALSYLKRIAIIAGARRYQVIWVHFEAFPWMPALFERLLDIAGRPVVIDFDDAIFHQYGSHRSRLVSTLLGDKLRPLLRRASVITVGNDYLKRYVSRFNDAVTVIPTVVDTDRYVARTTENALPLVVGWIGSPSTWRYVEHILPDILPLIKARGAVFRAVGAGPAAGAWRDVERVDWREDDEVQQVQRMDIGIMPLPEENWARGKCGYKLIQYMACGLPTIASPVGVNSEIVEDGITGLLASSVGEWREALERLLDDSALRRRFGARGRARVVERYSLVSQRERVLTVFRNAASRK